MIHEIVYHGEITLKGVSQVERILTRLLGDPDQEVVLNLCSGGGETTAGTGLYSFMKMMPFPINTHALGWCASAAMTIFLAGKRRTATPTTQFMLHAAQGAHETVSEHVHQAIDTFRRELGWDQPTLDDFFSTTTGHYIHSAEALRLGIVHELQDRTIVKDSSVHLIEL